MNLKIMDNCYEQFTCLACGSDNIHLILDLKEQPLANSYKKNKEDDEKTFPLAVNLCGDCFHLQLTHIVDPKTIYSNYLYVAGTSKTLKDYSNWFAGYVNESIDKKTNRILDIGCNDGTQLNAFKDLGFNTFGIDPAENIHSTSSKNHNIICGYFNKEIVNIIDKGYDAITAQNVFAHNPDPLEFLNNCSRLMDDHTLLFIQTSQAEMVSNNEFDTIYHEHINFFNANSMYKITSRAGLNLIDAIKTPIHGTSYIFVISKNTQHRSNIENVIRDENSLLVEETYNKWKTSIDKNMYELKRTLEEYRHMGYRLIGYGAAAKGNTLLNYINVGFDYIVDDNPMKQGLYTPGQSIPIQNSQILDLYSSDDKIIFIPLAWNFFNEIKEKILSIRYNKEDKFLKYFPNVEVLDV